MNLVIFEDKIQYQEMVARNLSPTDFWQKARSEIVWAEGPSSKRVSYRIILNVLSICYLAIIPRNRVVYELIANEARSAELAIARIRRD